MREPGPCRRPLNTGNRQHSMKAAVFDSFGEPAEVLHVRDVPEPHPGPGEVRVRMIMSPVNPSDMLVVRGRYGVLPSLPSTPGFEGVGVVDEVGSGLLGRLVKGKRVLAINGAGGNWAEYAVIPARQARPIADDIPDEQAAAAFVNPTTVLALARHVLKVRRGEWLLQSAAGSTLGRMMIKLGRHDGFQARSTSSAVARRSTNSRRLGADAVISSAEGPIDEQVRRIVGCGRGSPRDRPRGRRDGSRRLPLPGGRWASHPLRHALRRADLHRSPARDLGPPERRGLLARPLDARAIHPCVPPRLPGDGIHDPQGRPRLRDRPHLSPFRDPRGRDAGRRGRPPGQSAPPPRETR